MVELFDLVVVGNGNVFNVEIVNVIFDDVGCIECKFEFIRFEILEV